MCKFDYVRLYIIVDGTLSQNKAASDNEAKKSLHWEEKSQSWIEMI